MQATEIRCPRCNSNQLTANKKGFSGKKAVVGGLLTGGVGLLAGTIGSNKIKITCLACGKEFLPGEGKTSIIQIENEVKDSSEKEVQIIDEDDKQLLEICQKHGKLTAIKVCKEKKKIDLVSATDYVNQLVSKHGITTKNVSGGCVVLLTALTLSFSLLLYLISISIF